MKVTIETLQKRHFSEDWNLMQVDADKATLISNEIENLVFTLKTPQSGDYVLCKNGDILYKRGYFGLHQGFGKEHTVCTQPYEPHVSISQDGRLGFSVSGGYWLSIDNQELKKFKWVDQRSRIFWTWGNRGARVNGGIYFPAVVNVWEYENKEFY